MKILVVLFLALVLAAVLVAADAEEKGAVDGGAAAPGSKSENLTPEERKKKQEENCNTFCADKKKPGLNRDCKETCALNQHARMVIMEAFICSLDCAKVHGLTSQATKACEEEKCKKEYEEKEAEINATCNEVCSRVEKEPAGVEKCKKTCIPSLIIKDGAVL